MDKLDKVAKDYRRGNISIEQAPHQAGVSVWEMADYLKEQNIQPPA